MRRALLLLLLACAVTARAEVFKCLAPSGATVFSDVPCDEGEKFQKVRPSESLSDPAAAQRELERQRVHAERVAAENEAARQSKAGAGALPDYSSPPPSLSPSSSETTPRSPSTSPAANPGPQPRDAPPMPAIPPLPRTSPPVSR